jgi:hypothetical protein
MANVFRRKDNQYFITKPSKPTKPSLRHGGSQPLAARKPASWRGFPSVFYCFDSFVGFVAKRIITSP